MTQNTRYYAGIGSRETPAEVLAIMTALAQALAGAGWVLRSGGADGADSAFEQGAQAANGRKDIYLPWRGFNNNSSSLFEADKDAYALAATVHPAWDQLGAGPRALHSRNCYQVLGRTLDTPVEFTVCWTPDGCENEKSRKRTTGGTGTAIVLSERNGVPVFNLRNDSSRERLNAVLRRHGIPYEVPLTPQTQLSMF